jgi:Carboxypeptidase regulatory-like domain
MVQSAFIRLTALRNGLQQCRLPLRARWGPRRYTLYILFCCLPFLTQAQQIEHIDTPLPDAPTMGTPAAQDASAQNPGDSLGTISGTVVDQNGNFVFSALVRLQREGHIEEREAVSDKEGHFTFAGVPAGPFRLTVGAVTFADQEVAGILHPGEALEVPQISLLIGAATTEVRVSVTNYELAEEQVKIEETQRVLGVFPNFYVTYQQDTLPLRPKQKFELAWKTSVDPVTFAVTGGFAGVQQAENTFSGYGQGAQGYAKRYGASYGDSFIGAMVGGAILPSLLKQDPRYFYKGTGSTRSRILYAIANAVICKGDNGHWQPDYSGILGSLAAGGISNLYYPASSRNGAWLTFENTFIGLGGSAAGNLFQEFLVRKLTPHTRGPQTINP